MTNSSSSNPFWWTPLYETVWHLDVEKVRFLLLMDADVNAQDSLGRTPLCVVSLPHNDRDYLDVQRIEITKLLLNAGANVHNLDHCLGTPLHDAALWGCEVVASILLEHGADINARTNNGWTPLHSAVRGGHQEMVKLLLLKGADVNDRGAEWGGEKSLMPSIPARKYTPLGLVTIAIKGAKEVAPQTDWPDIFEPDLTKLTHLEELSKLLSEYGGSE